jgi:hypothetical protein
MTRMVSAVAAFTRSHPRIVPLALLAAGTGVATFGAISLLTPPGTAEGVAPAS